MVAAELKEVGVRAVAKEIRIDLQNHFIHKWHGWQDIGFVSVVTEPVAGSIGWRRGMQWQAPLIFLIDQLVFRPGVWILSRRPS